jgi:hypothetical protein
MTRYFLSIICIFVFILYPLNIGYAKFGSNRRPEVNKNAVMITTRGAIIMNKKVDNKYLKGFDHVSVEYSYAVGILTIKPLVKPNSESLFIYRVRNGKVIILFKKNHLRKKGASISNCSYYEAVWNPIDKVIEIDYNNPITRKNLE